MWLIQHLFGIIIYHFMVKSHACVLDYDPAHKTVLWVIPLICIGSLRVKMPSLGVPIAQQQEPSAKEKPLCTQIQLDLISADNDKGLAC